MKPIAIRSIQLLITFILILVLLPWSKLLDGLEFNQSASLALSALLGNDNQLSSADANLAARAEQNCRAYWYQGVIRESNSADIVPYETLEAALDCDPNLIAILQSKYPENIALAEHAVAAQPDSAEAWFWLGDLLPEKRVQYYLHGLDLSPNDGRRWISVGDMLREPDPEAALQAYLNGCFNGDPGANGCLRAGSVAEELGDYQSALKYYRLSSYIGSHRRADELEQRLLNTDSP